MVSAGQVYRHYKGNAYTILTLAEHTETNERMVVYQDIGDPGKIWVRPIDLFLKPAVVDGKEVARFELQQ